MTQVVKAYCPPRDTVTVLHLRDMANGTKGKILATEVKHLYVPQYESLSIEKILAKAKEHYPAVVERYLPTLERELLKYPRQVRISFTILCHFLLILANSKTKLRSRRFCLVFILSLYSYFDPYLFLVHH
jgi:hypothetical protein